MISEEQLYWLRLCGKKYLSPRVLFSLFKHFGSAENILRATKEELFHAQLSPQGIEALTKEVFCDVERLEKLMNEEDIRAVVLSDEYYPKSLLEIPDPPPILFYRGNIENVSFRHVLAIVGSRRCTRYARDGLSRCLDRLPVNDFLVVSGLAYGVDTLAHEFSVNREIKTWAILGSGVSKTKMYPKQNEKLAENIVKKGGALISELLPWEEARPQFFPRRNRIIAGLSHVVFVVEARERSGALVTASLARDYGRDVAALPGSIFSQTSCGTNKLIQEGAGLIQTSMDILELFGISVQEKFPLRKSYDESTEILLRFLHEKNSTVEELESKTHFTIHKIHSIVSILELDGVVQKIHSDEYGLL